jgi:hypothetical protein
LLKVKEMLLGRQVVAVVGRREFLCFHRDLAGLEEAAADTGHAAGESESRFHWRAFGSLF